MPVLGEPLEQEEIERISLLGDAEKEAEMKELLLGAEGTEREIKDLTARLRRFYDHPELFARCPTIWPEHLMDRRMLPYPYIE